MNTKTLYLHKINEEILSPREFLNLKSSDRDNISRAEVIPPRLGQNGFGKIRVRYKRPLNYNLIIRD